MRPPEAEYERLVAAHCLRSPSFAATYLPLLERVSHSFWGEALVRDVVQHGLAYFKQTGKLLPKAALKQDVVLFAPNAFHPDRYVEIVDEVWAHPPEALDATVEHVQSTLLREARMRMAKQLQAEPLSEANLERWVASLDEIKSLSTYDTIGAVEVTEGLWDALTSDRRGAPSGVPYLDKDLKGGVIGLGETLVWFGQYNIGKSMVAHEAAVAQVRRGQPALVVTLETSKENTQERLVRKLMGCTYGDLTSDVGGWRRRWEESGYDDLLFVEYAPGDYPMSKLKDALDKVENRISRKVELVVLDYSELRAKAYAWDSVRSAYKDFRSFCGERGLAGVDVAQENAQGNASYQGVFKDCDIGVRMAVDRFMLDKPGYVAQRSLEESMLYCKVTRNREGPVGRVFVLDVDRSTGQVTAHTSGV